MSLDVGDVRIGIALSDPLGISAQPFSTIERKGRYLNALIGIMTEQEVSKVIIGLPYELNGSLGPQGEKVQKFAAELRAALDRRGSLKDREIIFWDERLTTVAAKRVLAGSGLKNKDCHSALDRVSAALILDGYMNSKIG